MTSVNVKPAIIESFQHCVANIELHKKLGTLEVQGKRVNQYKAELILKDKISVKDMISNKVDEQIIKMSETEQYHFWTYTGGTFNFGVQDVNDIPKYGKYWSGNARSFYKDVGLRLIEVGINNKRYSTYITVEQLLLFLSNKYQCIDDGDGGTLIVDNLGFEDAFTPNKVFGDKAVVIEEIYGQQIKLRNNFGKLEVFPKWFSEHNHEIVDDKYNNEMLAYLKKCAEDEKPILVIEMPKVCIGVKVEGERISIDKLHEKVDSGKILIYENQVRKFEDVANLKDITFINCYAPLTHTSQTYITESMVCLNTIDGGILRAPIRIQDYGWDVKEEYKNLVK